ncbi:lipopolysaccharide kinase InaA family protein [Halomonas sp. Bachu 37]|uniref:lipopolysaccharide kinase InaA family protein n=1 Tax=Halomonas kashgarensis TaxID=3084920 RepID=UPI003216C835
MRLTKITINGTSRRYLLFQQRGRPHSYQLDKDAHARRLDGAASSEFYFDSQSGALAKFKADKYSRSNKFLRWLLRDYIEKRLFFQFDARKEVRSLRIIRAAGLSTPECMAWGVSFDKRNRLGSLLVMEHVANAVTGAEYFTQLPEEQRHTFLTRLCDELLRLASIGYVHRDLHMENFLCRPNGEIVWIDTHVRSLPRGKRAQRQVVYRSVSQLGLLDEPYRDWLHTEMKRRWQAKDIRRAC